jgi:hypothetical protein
MIAKGNLHSHGQKLAAYLVKGHPGERGELIEMRGFAASDLRVAFRDVEIQAGGTACRKPFFHCYTRLAPGEALEQERWLQIADREEKRLGFTGQPRAVSFHHLADGSVHMHIAWSRIALSEDGRLFAIDPGLYKNKLKELSRELEKELDLKLVRNERAPDDRTRAAGRNEFEQARRLGTDLKAIRNTIRDCWERSDSGKSFAAALEAQGLMLARGDRRDFVIVDPAGGDHALSKRITGATVAETRARMSDVDRAKLPGVDQAKAVQAECQTAREAVRTQEREVRAPAPPLKPPLKPLGKTAGEIRLAWSLTRSAEAFAQALEERGLILVHVSAEEARASERARAFAKTIGHQNRALKEGYAVVDQRGNVTRIDQRVTGDQREEIDKRLGRIDPASLLSVTDAKEAMREANRAAWAERKERERPMTAIETRIADALKTTMDGHEFAAALDKAGLTVARTTAADVKALDALRQDAQSAAVAARANDEENTTRTLFARLEVGDLAAVNRQGDVFRLSPLRLDYAEIEQRLGDVQPRLPSVVEARAASETIREQTTELWAQRRADNAAARLEGWQAKQADRDIRSTAKAAESEGRKAVDTAERTVDKAAHAGGVLLGGLRKGVEMVGALLGDMISPTKPPGPEEAKCIEQQQAENAEARAFESARQEKDRAQDDLLFEQRRSKQQTTQDLYSKYGGVLTRDPDDPNRERDDDRSRERDRGDR